MPAWTYFGVMPFARRQRISQRFHRLVVADAVQRDQALELGAERRDSGRQIAHRGRRQAVQLQRAAGLRMRRVHRRVHPDPIDGDVLKDLRIEPGDVILVLVRHHEQIETRLPPAAAGSSVSTFSTAAFEMALPAPSEPQSTSMWKSSSGADLSSPWGSGSRSNRRLRRCRL